MLKQPEKLFGFVLLISVLCFGTSDATAQSLSQHPLAPVNTRSPRSTLEQFKTNLEEAYRIAGENRLIVESKFLMQRASRCLNLENTPLELRQNRGFEAALMLKEILDRVELPPFNEIPGDEEIEKRAEDDKNPLEFWTIPNTEIRIGRVNEGHVARSSFHSGHFIIGDFDHVWIDAVCWNHLSDYRHGRS